VVSDCSRGAPVTLLAKALVSHHLQPGNTGEPCVCSAWESEFHKVGKGELHRNTISVNLSLRAETGLSSREPRGDHI
jgi:hypothetical protein